MVHKFIHFVGGERILVLVDLGPNVPEITCSRKILRCDPLWAEWDMFYRYHLVPTIHRLIGLERVNYLDVALQSLT